MTNEDSVAAKMAELRSVADELRELDEHRVALGNRLVDLEHWFRRTGRPELSDRALDVFATRYMGRVLELADGMRE